MMEPALQLAQKIRGRLSALAPRLVLRADAGAELLFDSGRHSLRILLYGDTAKARRASRCFPAYVPRRLWT